MCCDIDLSSAFRVLSRAGVNLQSQPGTKEYLAEVVQALVCLTGTDAMTGLANRRTFEQEATRTLAMVQRDQAAALLIVDIDHFKRINDTHGHTVGDVVIREVARVLKGNVRNNDVVARLGGEEFAVILNMADQNTVRITAERLRLAVAQLADTVPVTVSVGVSCAVRGESKTLEQWYKEADAALYQSKHGGRNQVSEYAHVVPAHAAH